MRQDKKRRRRNVCWMYYLAVCMYDGEEKREEREERERRREKRSKKKRNSRKVSVEIEIEIEQIETDFWESSQGSR